MKPAILIPGLAVAIIAGTAVLASPMGGMGRDGGPRFDFEAMDADGDGKLTRTEIEAGAKARFAESDTDGDGALSAEEMVAAAQARAAERAAERHARMLAWRDSDGDGKLSFEEMGGARMARMLERVDADGDGAVTKDEMARMRDRMGERGEHRGFGKRGHHEHGHGDGEGYRHMRD